MDYRAAYARLIERARGRELTGYCERHHVVPRCMGGGDEATNMVRLTPEEHYLAHQLLVKLNPGHTGLVWAASAMAGSTGKQQRSNKLYGWLRRRFAACMSNTHKGRTASPETRAKQAAAKLGKKRAPHSAETKAKMSAAARGRKRSPEHCAALSRAKSGKKRKPHSEETKARMRAAQAKIAHRIDKSFTQDPSYRLTQSNRMKAIWAARKAA